MEKQYKPSIIKNHKITKKNDGVPIPLFALSSSEVR